MPTEALESNSGTEKHYSLEPGPHSASRKPHDLLFLLLFIIATLAMAAILGFGIKYGSLHRLFYGQDSEGNYCGANIGTDSKRDLSNQEHLYYFNLALSKTYSRCVNSCETAGNNSSGYVCAYGVFPSSNSLTLSLQIINGSCTKYIPSISRFQRCVPTIITDSISNSTNFDSNTKIWANTLAKKLNERRIAQVIFDAIYPLWWILVITAIIAIILSFIWIFIMQIMSGLLVWITIGSVLLSLWGLSAFLCYSYVMQKYNNDHLLSTGFPSIDSNEYNQYILLGLFILVIAVTLVFTIVLCFFLKSIRIAIALTKEAANAIRSFPTICFFPLLKCAIFVILTCIAIFTASLLSTSGEMINSNLQYSTNSTIFEISGQSFVPNSSVEYLTIYVAFWYFWNCTFIAAITHCTIAGAIASWYWTRNRDALPKFQVMKSLKRVLYYHLGSLALGSLIIALFMTVRFIIYLFQRMAKRAHNKILQCILCCFQCCLKCCQSLIEILNKNAYIEIAIYGYSFCEAAHVAFRTLSRNLSRLVAVEWVCAFINSAGKLLISSLTGLCALGIFIKYTSNQIQSETFAVLLVMALIIGYVISNIFLKVFSATTETLLICFCEDCERNDGSSKPYYMPDSLRKLMDKNRKSESPAIDGF